ncbi:imm11 family protein [Prevotella pallens]|uniref:imm11 family protein n=1 Tax=Prevotella pallens TaxID=60133 RepID=UPI0028EE401D|nr:DUF1629 domain-containing protein [Prevotella pallens]
MYYQLSEFYKRDIYLQYAEENSIEYNAFEKGERIEIKSEIFYKVDKIDDYLNNYDVLPTFGTPLVSSKFVKLFKEYEKDVQFLRVNIKDMDGNTNRNFYIPNILKIVPCLDEEKSVVETKKYGSAIIKVIKQLYIVPNSIRNSLMVRMKEKTSYIIVTEQFKKLCESANLKGINLIEEGASIYTNI